MDLLKPFPLVGFSIHFGGSGTFRVLVRHGAARRVAWPDEEDVPLVSHIARLRSTLDMPPLPFVDLLVARNFEGAITSRFANGPVGNSWPEAWTSSHMPWSGQPPEHKQTKFLLYRSCRTQRRPPVWHWDDRGEDFNASLVVEQFLRKHWQTHIHMHMHMHAHARACARACELEFVHVSLNSITLFFVAEGRWFLHVFSCSFPILSFYLSLSFLLFIPKPFTKTAVIHLSTFVKTVVTSALDWINPRSTVCRFMCSHQT